MLGLLFPTHVDNTYRGHKLALWLFGLVVLAKLGIGFGSVFNTYQAASQADGIPLDRYPSAAAETVVSLFALLGWLHIMLGVICVAVLIRYRAIVPLMPGPLIVEHLRRRAVRPPTPTGR